MVGKSIAAARAATAPEPPPTAEAAVEALRTLTAFLGSPTANAAPADALVRIEAKALAAHGLELRGVLALVDAGALKVVRIGRARFTTVSRLVALVDELDAAPTPKRAEPAIDPDVAEMRDAAARKAARAPRRIA